MSVPTFEVHVMLACRLAAPEGPHGPGALAGLPYTLEGVTYTFRIDPHQEPPFAIGELWLYLRLAWANSVAGRRELGLKVFAVRPDNTTEVVEYPFLSGSNEPYSLGPVNFTAAAPVVSLPVRVANLVVPRTGRYEFRLYAKRPKPDWRGREWQRVARHFIAVER
jgi:hypothetical protein